MDMPAANPDQSSALRRRLSSSSPSARSISWMTSALMDECALAWIAHPDLELHSQVGVNDQRAFLSSCYEASPRSVPLSCEGKDAKDSYGILSFSLGD